MIGPDHPDFEKLPRKEQALILRNDFHWKLKPLCEELDVSRSVLRRWLNPKLAESHRNDMRERMRRRRATRP